MRDYNDTNLGRDFAPHRKSCSCVDCTVDRQAQKITALQAENATLRKAFEIQSADLDDTNSRFDEMENELAALKAAQPVCVGYVRGDAVNQMNEPDPSYAATILHTVLWKQSSGEYIHPIYLNPSPPAGQESV